MGTSISEEFKKKIAIHIPIKFDLEHRPAND